MINTQRSCADTEHFDNDFMEDLEMHCGFLDESNQSVGVSICYDPVLGFGFSKWLDKPLSLDMHITLSMIKDQFK